MFIVAAICDLGGNPATMTELRAVLGPLARRSVHNSYLVFLAPTKERPFGIGWLKQRVSPFDDLEWGFSRVSASIPGYVPVLGSLVIPFPKTPLRILERTAIDYTPLGFLKDRVREAWVSGDRPQCDGCPRHG